MDKEFTTWIQKRKAEFRAIRKYLFPLIFKGFLASVAPWLTIFVLALIANVIAIAITYFRGEDIELASFFPPNLGWGLLAVLIALFAYQLAVTIAMELASLRVRADKLTWNDIDINVFPFPPDNLHGVGISLTNTKPFMLKNAFVEIIYLQQDNQPHPYSDRILPHPLPWIHGSHSREYHWGKDDIHPNGGKQMVGLFNLSNFDTRNGMVYEYHIPGENGQPGERKALDSFTNENVVVVELEFKGDIDGIPLSPLQKRYRAFYNGSKFEVFEM